MLSEKKWVYYLPRNVNSSRIEDSHVKRWGGTWYCKQIIAHFSPWVIRNIELKYRVFITKPNGIIAIHLQLKKSTQSIGKALCRVKK